MSKFEVGVLASFSVFVDFAIGGIFTTVVSLKFVQEGLVRGLGEHAFFFQDGQDTHRLE